MDTESVEEVTDICDVDIFEEHSVFAGFDGNLTKTKGMEICTNESALLTGMPLYSGSAVACFISLSKIRSLVDCLGLEDVVVCQTVSVAFRTQAVHAAYGRYINPSNRFILCLGESAGNRYFLGDSGVDSFAHSNLPSDSLSSPIFGLSRMLFCQRLPQITKRTFDKFLHGLGDLQLELGHHRVTAHSSMAVEVASIEFHINEAYAACAATSATLSCSTLLRDMFGVAHRSLKLLSVSSYGRTSTTAVSFVSLQLSTINEALSNPHEKFPRLRELIMPTDFMFTIMTKKTARRLAKTLEVLDMTQCPNIFGFLARNRRLSGNPSDGPEFLQYKRVHTLRVREGYYRASSNSIDVMGSHNGFNRTNLFRSLPNLRYVVIQRCSRDTAVMSPPSADAADRRNKLQVNWGETDHHGIVDRRKIHNDRNIVMPIVKKCDFLLGLEAFVNNGSTGFNNFRPSNLPQDLIGLCGQLLITDAVRANNLPDLGGGAPLSMAKRFAYAKYFARLHNMHCSSSSSDSGGANVSNFYADNVSPHHTVKLKRPRILVRFDLNEYRCKPYEEVTEWLDMFELQRTCAQEPYIRWEAKGYEIPCNASMQQVHALWMHATSTVHAYSVNAEEFRNLLPPSVRERQLDTTVAPPPPPPPVSNQSAPPPCAGMRKTLNSMGRRRCGADEEVKAEQVRAPAAGHSNPYAIPRDCMRARQHCQLQISQLYVKTAFVAIDNTIMLHNYRQQFLAAVLMALAGLPASCVTKPKAWGRTDSQTIGGYRISAGGMTPGGGRDFRHLAHHRSKLLSVKNLRTKGASPKNRVDYFSMQPTRGDVAEPLLHVRHIRVQCCVAAGSPRFCVQPSTASAEETSYYCPQTDDIQDIVVEKSRPDDEDGKKSKAMPQQFQLISEDYRREEVAPLVRLIARRFVSLRYFSIVCDFARTSRKVLYNLDDVVLEERTLRPAEAVILPND